MSIRDFRFGSEPPIIASCRRMLRSQDQVKAQDPTQPSASGPVQTPPNNAVGSGEGKWFWILAGLAGLGAYRYRNKIGSVISLCLGGQTIWHPRQQQRLLEEIKRGLEDVPVEQRPLLVEALSSYFAQQNQQSLQKVDKTDLQQPVSDVKVRNVIEPQLIEQKSDLYASRWLDITKDPGTILIIGTQGSGKSAHGYYLLWLYRFEGAFVLGLPREVWDCLPREIGVIGDIGEAPNGSTVLIDEAYLQFFSRESQSKRARELIKILGLLRQKHLRLIFVAQQARYIDVDIFTEAKVIIIKEPGLFQEKTDRPQLAEAIHKAKEEIGAKQGNKQRYSYVVSAAFEGVLENPCPDFFNDKLSKAYAYGSAVVAEERAPRELSKEEKKEEARQLLREEDLSYREIGKRLGVPTTTIWRWLHEKKG